MNKFNLIIKAIKITGKIIVKLAKIYAVLILLGKTVKGLAKKKSFIIGAGFFCLFIFLGIITAVGLLLFTGPRMNDQPSIKTYEMIFPRIPAGTVTVETIHGFPGSDEANPLKNTKENLERGRVYYGYYCVFCHGTKGISRGYVADSYVPRPADLASSEIAYYSDSRLYRSMLTGNGHEPVLDRVVDQEYRWYIVLYVRSFQR